MTSVIPRFILDHTFFNDVYREDYDSHYQESARKFQDYLIFRQAIIRPKEKVAITPSEVFIRIFDKTHKYPKYWPQIWLAVRSFMDISYLTHRNPHVNHKEASVPTS